MKLHRPSKAALQYAAFFATSGFGICFLVFLNAAQPFVLNDILQVPKEKAGRISGTLVLCDELLALVFVLLWGRLSDVYSARLVTATANIVIGISLFLFVEARNAFPQLLLVRLLFAIGSAGVTAMLSALVSILSVPSPTEKDSETPSTPASEEQPLLGWSRPTPPPEQKNKSTRLAASLGVSAGLGALLAVFFFLRLPSKLFPLDASKGLKVTFRIVGVVAFANSILAFIGLPRSTVSQATKHSTSNKWILVELEKITKGFSLARQNRVVALGYATGFAARAQTIIVSSFVPLYVASYYRDHGLCGEDAKPGEDLKAGCHPAYAFASALTGVIQLIALLVAPFLAFSRNPPRSISVTFTVGVLAFAILGRCIFKIPTHSPKDLGAWDDPRSWWTWAAAIGIGIAMISGTVLSLAVVSIGRKETLEERNEQKITSVTTEDPNLVVLETTGPRPAETNGSAPGGEEVAGALAGAYSFCGGLGIVFISGISSLIVDKNPGSPFILMACIDLVIFIFATIVTTTRQNAGLD